MRSFFQIYSLFPFRKFTSSASKKDKQNHRYLKNGGTPLSQAAVRHDLFSYLEQLVLPWRITFLNSLFQSVPLESPHICDSESAIAELKPYVYAVTRRQASAE